DLVGGELDVLDAKVRALEEAKARSVQKHRHEAGNALQLVEDVGDLLAREDGWKAARLVGADDVREPGEVLAEHLAVQEKDRAERLILRGCRDASAAGEEREVFGDFVLTHHHGMALAVEEDESADPAGIGPLGPAAEVPR